MSLGTMAARSGSRRIVGRRAADWVYAINLIELKNSWTHLCMLELVRQLKDSPKAEGYQSVLGSSKCQLADQLKYPMMSNVKYLIHRLATLAEQFCQHISYDIPVVYIQRHSPSFTLLMELIKHLVDVLLDDRLLLPQCAVGESMG
jgi:hypothetical protein